MPIVVAAVGRFHKMKRKIECLFLCLSLTLVASQARAQTSELVRPGTRAFWASLSVGPAMGIRDGQVSFWGLSVDYPTPDQFKLAQTFGYHFSGTSAGPAIALDLQESFGDEHFIFEVLPRFLWDVELFDDLGVYLTPSFGFGYIHGVANNCTGDCTANGMTLQFCVAAKVILSDRFMVFLRPFGLDVTPINASYWGIDSWITPIRYDMMFGAGATF
jgi:hypothetical protein